MSRRHPRNAPRKKAYRPRPVAVNAFEIAITGVQPLPLRERLALMASLRAALTAFGRGQDCARHWMSLADAGNMAETLAGLGLGSGAQADDAIERAQRAPADVAGRATARGSWTLYADEIDALGWLLDLHDVQLRACTRAEYERAMRQTFDRVMQARAGNAPRGAVVVEALAA